MACTLSATKLEIRAQNRLVGRMTVNLAKNSNT
jgi:hypothetical protein